MEATGEYGCDRRGNGEAGDADFRSERAGSGSVLAPCPKESSADPQWDLAAPAAAVPVADDFGFGRGEAGGCGIGGKERWGREEEIGCS